MFNINEWLPAWLKDHPISSCLILLILGGGMTYEAINATVISGMKVRSENQNHENQLLQKNLELLQSRYDTVLASRDDEVERKVNAMSVVLNKSLNTLTNRYTELLKENQNLRNTFNQLNSDERQRQDELKEHKIKELSAQLIANNHRIDETQASLQETSSNAGSHKKNVKKNRTSMYLRHTVHLPQGMKLK
ncbi:hypothetical protein [Pantoea agglomerans]|uniref:hypothetical protein n=1 Tax=Enterobacter agglomerans TaxID=549 RepID=UPI001F2DD6C5|nr:hypothetical protein [Pantoea agglomerans]UJL39234.1 hypothetical protein JK642_19980 [Pantoea agglomerans]